jgi:hypothetical protein
MSRAPKGHILFAQRVDEQLQVLLFGQVEAAMNRIKAGFAEKYRPEIEAVIGILYYYLSFSRDGPTPGMSTFGLGFHRTFPLGISWFAGCDRNDLPSAGDIPSPSPRTTDNKESERRESRGIDKYIPLFVVACIYGFRRLERQSLLGDWRREPQGSLKNRMYVLMLIELWAIYHVIVIISPIEWCIEEHWSSSIILCNNNTIAHNHHTNNNPFIFQPLNQLIQVPLNTRARHLFPAVWHSKHPHVPLPRGVPLSLTSH